ncbi:hypothetical protein ACMFMG_000588 [Clarireedia jacksonii]
MSTYSILAHVVLKRVRSSTDCPTSSSQLYISAHTTALPVTCWTPMGFGSHMQPVAHVTLWKILSNSTNALLYSRFYKSTTDSSPAIANIMGSDVNAPGIRYQFDTRFKVVGKRQLVLLSAGEDPLSCYGSDATAAGIKFQFATTFKKNVADIQAARLSGTDCKDITLNSLGHISFPSVAIYFRASHCTLPFEILILTTGMAKHFGSDATVDMISWQFRGIRAGAKIQMETLADGKDPKDVNVIVNHKGEPMSSRAASGPSKCILAPLPQAVSCFRIHLVMLSFT